MIHLVEQLNVNEDNVFPPERTYRVILARQIHEGVMVNHLTIMGILTYQQVHNRLYQPLSKFGVVG